MSESNNEENVKVASGKFQGRKAKRYLVKRWNINRQLFYMQYAGLARINLGSIVNKRTVHCEEV